MPRKLIWFEASWKQSERPARIGDAPMHHPKTKLRGKTVAMDRGRPLARTRHPRESLTPLRNEALLLFGVRNPEFLDSFLDSGVLVGCVHTTDEDGRGAAQTIDISAEFVLGHSPN